VSTTPTEAKSTPLGPSSRFPGCQKKHRTASDLRPARADPFDWAARWAWPAIESGDLTSTEGLVALVLAAHGNRDGIAWPGERTLGKLVGRSGRTARLALIGLRKAGYIDGSPESGCVTQWRFVIDEDERARLRQTYSQIPTPRSATPPFAVPANPSVAAREEQVRTECEPTANPSHDEGEGEGKTLSSLTVVARRQRERERIDNGSTVLSLRGRRSRKRRAAA
jgi:hypothetical protein